LKASYRERLSRGVSDFRTVYLHGSFDTIRSRMESRSHRYMPAALLESQFAVLEPPTDAIAIDVAATPDECVAAILRSCRADTGLRRRVQD
jgi:carbohydrate kinase (thermoresistant glucokinase family)